jgi:Mn-dependent DtxR family transcriptional regulator
MARPVPTPPGAAREHRDAALPRLRLIGRLSAAYLLDSAGIVRGDGDIVDALLAGAIIQANVQEINGRADLQLEYAEADRIPPNALRRPVSMNALANSLKLPFETVRRRVKRMERDGFCRFVHGGVIVPTEVLQDPKYAVDAYRAYERLRAFYYELSDLGLLAPLPPPSVDLAGDLVPFRVVARLSGAYVLRVAEALNLIGEMTDALIVLEIFRSNLEHLPLEPAGGEGFSVEDMIDDSQRQPVTAARLAARLGLPPETVRRHVARLVERGLCRRAPGGLVVPARTFTRPNLRDALAVNAGNLQRLFGALSQLGVLRIWDAARTPA